jgi:hypothetical protein
MVLSAMPMMPAAMSAAMWAAVWTAVWTTTDRIMWHMDTIVGYMTKTVHMVNVQAVNM